MARFLAAVLAFGGIASGAELKVMAIGAINPGFRTIADRYGKEAGLTVTMLADTAPGLTRRISAGETGDLLIAPDNVIDEAAKLGKVVVATRVPVAKVGIGIAVRRGAFPSGGAPGIATVDALKRALLDSERVVYNQGSSGLYIDKMFEQMGVAGDLKAKTVRYANAAQVVNHVMAGQGHELGFAPLPEILSQDSKKLESLGPLPASVQNYTGYTGVVMMGANAAAAEFLHYLVSPESRRTFAAAGVD